MFIYNHKRKAANTVLDSADPIFFTNITPYGLVDNYQETVEPILPMYTAKRPRKLASLTVSRIYNNVYVI
jgi:hypothetical protein